MGRPRLDQKEGFHRHDGYDRLHPIDQHHWMDMHSDPIKKSNDDVSEVVQLLSEIEQFAKQNIGTEMLVELQKSIETMLQAKKAKANHNGRPKEQREEQSVLGDNEGEVREPNTIGLP
tara:strand:- start:302 stop:655 length:354 start_codon:yes stop_codon:yes gene_type:complete